MMDPGWKTVTYQCWDCEKVVMTWLGRMVHGLVRHGVLATNAYYERQYHASVSAKGSSDGGQR